MKLLEALAGPCKQQEFAAAVGVSEPRVSLMLSEGYLQAGGTAGEWLLAYCTRLREQAAGRGHELTSERAGLAREQRIAQALKNAVAQGDYAPVGLLTDVLASASASIAVRLEALPSELRLQVPDLTDEQAEQLAQLLASARNEWVVATAALADRLVDELAEDDDADAGQALAADPADPADPLPDAAPEAVDV